MSTRLSAPERRISLPEGKEIIVNEMKTETKFIRNIQVSETQEEKTETIFCMSIEELMEESKLHPYKDLSDKEITELTELNDQQLENVVNKTGASVIKIAYKTKEIFLNTLPTISIGDDKIWKEVTSLKLERLAIFLKAPGGLDLLKVNRCISIKEIEKLNKENRAFVMNNLKSVHEIIRCGMKVESFIALDKTTRSLLIQYSQYLVEIIAAGMSLQKLVRLNAKDRKIVVDYLKIFQKLVEKKESIKNFVFESRVTQEAEAVPTHMLSKIPQGFLDQSKLLNSLINIDKKTGAQSVIDEENKKLAFMPLVRSSLEIQQLIEESGISRQTLASLNFETLAIIGLNSQQVKTLLKWGSSFEDLIALKPDKLEMILKFSGNFPVLKSLGASAEDIGRLEVLGIAKIIACPSNVRLLLDNGITFKDLSQVETITLTAIIQVPRQFLKLLECGFPFNLLARVQQMNALLGSAEDLHKFKKKAKSSLKAQQELDPKILTEILQEPRKFLKLLNFGFSFEVLVRRENIKYLLECSNSFEKMQREHSISFQNLLILEDVKRVLFIKDIRTVLDLMTIGLSLEEINLMTSGSFSNLIRSCDHRKTKIQKNIVNQIKLEIDFLKKKLSDAIATVDLSLLHAPLELESDAAAIVRILEA